MAQGPGPPRGIAENELKVSLNVGRKYEELLRKARSQVEPESQKELFDVSANLGSPGLDSGFMGPPGLVSGLLVVFGLDPGLLEPPMLDSGLLGRPRLDSGLQGPSGLDSGLPAPLGSSSAPHTS